MRIPELLCPAGDESALKAAVDCGANAVYLGYSRFGARASATNFDAETLGRAVRYAHLYHARVHVTVNTLVKQSEIEGVRETLAAISDAGADAVIVQDLGVAELVRREFPALAMHASTQMGFSNATDARYAMAHGYSRVVLARECSLQTIREVAQTGIETEVFGHGALCSSVSGRCLLSSMAGGRSGNRGRCAQPCRQLFALDGRFSALLSLKDLCTLGDLAELCGAGVASLKLEGRLKSAEYVAVVTRAYRAALDQLQSGAVSTDDPEAMRELLQIFNRGGFTRGHAMNAQDAELCEPERVNHFGVPLGRVTGVKNGFAFVRTDAALHDGDSLRLAGAREIELRYAGQEVPAGQTARVRLRPGDMAEAGGAVSRLADATQLARARDHAPKPIAVKMRASFAQGEPMRLVMSDGQSEISALGDAVEAAKSRESTPEDARKQLCKLGGTPFALERDDDLTIDLASGLFLPVSALNALRRDAVERLTEKRITAFAQSGRPTSGVARGATDAQTAEPVPAQALKNSVSAKDVFPIDASTLAVLYSDASLSRELLSAGATMLLYDPCDLRPSALESELAKLPEGAWVQLPQQASEETLAALLAAVGKRRGQIGGLSLGSVGQLSLETDLPILLGEGIAVTNVEAMKALEGAHASGFALWPEWTRDELWEMAPFALPPLLKVYGREQLMLLNHCPRRVLEGLHDRREQCALCAGADMACGMHRAELSDRKGYRFPLQRVAAPEGCVLKVLGALPTLVDDNDVRIKLNAGALLRFTVEAAQDQVELTRAFAAWMRGGESPKNCEALKGQAVTGGHWRRGVE